MSKGKEVRLKKIPLGIFINALMDIYNSGLDYVDIVGKNGEEQDTIGIAFSEEYMSEDSENSFDELKQNLNDINLSDEDLNQLL